VLSKCFVGIWLFFFAVCTLHGCAQSCSLCFALSHCTVGYSEYFRPPGTVKLHVRSINRAMCIFSLASPAMGHWGTSPLLGYFQLVILGITRFTDSD